MNNTFSIKNAFKFGWDILKSNFSLLIGPIIAWVLIGILSNNSRSLFVLIFQFFNLVIVLGMIKLILGRYDGKLVRLDDIKFNIETYLNLFFFILVKHFVSILGNSFSHILPDPISKFIILIVGIYLWLRFVFAGYFIVDKKRNLLDALKRSFIITKGFELQLILFWLAVLGVNILGVFPGMFIGLIFVSFPVNLGASAYLYRWLVDKSDLQDNKILL